MALASAYGGSGIARISLGVRKLWLDKTIIGMATIFFLY